MLRRGEPRARIAARRGFLAGVLLMAGSFLVYPAYPRPRALADERPHAVEVTLVAAAISWAVFSVGLYLAGRRGWVWLRRRVKGARARLGAAAPRGAPVIDCRADGPRCWIS